MYAEIVRALVPGERVRIHVRDAVQERSARSVLKKANVPLDRVEFLRFPSDRGWTRDSGPIFLRAADGSQCIAGFRFNAWAKYADWKKDARLPQRASKTFGIPICAAEHNGQPVVLEGGAIDVNGTGSIITTEECLLDQQVQVRNPGFTRSDYESVFERMLGARNTIWLNKGIAGDDTHGHVDDLCRFVNEKTIVIVEETDPEDPNYRPLAENKERLQSATLEDGTKPHVITLPMPSPVVFNGQRLPASYANFYIANAAVLVPTFNDPNDRVALGILSELIPGRPVVGIHAVDLVWGLGTIHCLTQQQPRALPHA